MSRQDVGRPRYEFTEPILEPIIIEKFKLNITNEDLKTLDANNWLNDNIINFYLELIKGKFLSSKFLLNYIYSIQRTEHGTQFFTKGSRDEHAIHDEATCWLCRRSKVD